MDRQQLNDYYYGYNLRLADELGEFDKQIKQSPCLHEKIRLCNYLKDELLREARSGSALHIQKRERRILEEVFNDPLDEREQEFYPQY